MKLNRIFVTLILCILVLIYGPALQADTGDDPNPLFPVSVDGKWGFIDQTGKIVIEPEFAEVDDFSEGLAAVAELTGKKNILGGPQVKWGYIDVTGNWIIPPQYFTVKDFHEGLAGVYMNVEKKAKFGYIDKNGKTVIEPQFFTCGNFDNGVAIVELAFSEDGQKDIRCALIDKSGKRITKRKYEIINTFKNNYAIVEINDWISKHRLHGYIDRSGREITKCKYPNASNFSEGLACVQDGRWVWMLDPLAGGELVFWDPSLLLNGYWYPVVKFGYIDESGNYAIKPEFVDARSFSEGLAAAAIRDGEYIKWGYIDKSGEFVIKPIFDFAGSFSDGLACVYVNPWIHKKLGYIDKTGNMIIEPEYFNAGQFSEGLAAVSKYDFPNRKWSYIDKNGNRICGFMFDESGEFSNGFAIVGTRNENFECLYGLINQKGELVVEAKYDHIADFVNGIARVELGNSFSPGGCKVGYIDLTGKFIWEPTN